MSLWIKEHVILVLQNQDLNKIGVFIIGVLENILK
jgi:hypothetical protein